MARHIAANFVNLLIILVIALAGYVAYARSQFTAAGPLTEDTEFVVEPGARFTPIAERLAEEGVISDARLFRVAARYMDQDDKLKFGDYVVPAGASMSEVLELVTSGRGVGQRITFPEGFSIFEIVARLNATEDLTGEVAELPAEGTLSPNTYEFSRGESRQAILDKMAIAQSNILNAAWDNRQPDLPINTKEELLIVASILEKETPVKDELPLVAGVVYNRLNIDMPLGMDSTTVYEFTKGDPSKKRSIRRSDLVKQTPYNTRRFKGLPPTPIGNPGRQALEAAANPAETPFLYFVADGTGGHVFAETLAEHNANVAKWRQIERQRKAEGSN